MISDNINVYKVYFHITSIDGMHGGYKDIHAVYRVVARNEEMAEKKAYIKLKEDNAILNIKSFARQTKIRLIIGGCLY